MPSREQSLPSRVRSLEGELAGLRAIVLQLQAGPSTLAPPVVTQQDDGNLEGADDETSSEGGDADSDPLRPDELQAPLRCMLQAAGTSPVQPVGISPNSTTGTRRTKTRDMISHQLRALRRLLPFARGAFLQDYWDPVRLGLCDAREANRLFDS